ncbi:MAG: lytic transglycosylase domain-containing protein [Nitrospinae bacterium]|nr:lytic transglycosylase domain-containing protein [Nitrospinota bacterium]
MEIYGYLLKNFKDPVTEEAFRQFMEKRGPELKSRGMEVDSLAALLSVTEKKDEKREPNGQPDRKENNVYSNPSVQDFYNSLPEGNPKVIAEKALTALARYPGSEEARGIVSDLNHFIVKYTLSNYWEKDFESVADLYPASVLSELGYALWQNQMPDTAAILYKKILEKYPLETEACHKALFFLGRISEDKRDFPSVLDYYRQLLDRYDSGAYALAARFKIPWVEYLDKRFADARNHFQDLLDFHGSNSYARWRAIYPNSTNSYQAAGLYWLARTEEALGNEDASRALLQKMVDGFPFDFYSIVSRARFPGGLKGFFHRGERQGPVYRKPGLGDADNKRLARAEQLLAVGFLDNAKYELRKLPSGVDDPEFLFYLARLLDRARAYRKSIKLSWELAGKQGPDSFPRDLMESLFPKAFMDPALKVAGKYNLDPFLALSLMRQESAFDPEAVSRANAMGLMQLLPSTAVQVARGLELDAPTTENLKDPNVNIQLGVDYLKSLLDSFGGNLAHALAAYNAGPRKVREWAALRSGLDPLQFIESIPLGETREYVKAVVRNYYVYLALYGDREIADINELLTIPPR